MMNPSVSLDSQFQVIIQSVFPSVSLRYWPCSALFYHLSWRFLISFLLYYFLVSSTDSSPSVMTFLSALSVLLLMYSLRFLISFSTVCLIRRSPLPPFLCGRYSQSMSLCGCRVRWAVMSFLVLRSRSSSSAIVQSTMPAVYLIDSLDCNFFI